MNSEALPDGQLGSSASSEELPAPLSDEESPMVVDEKPPAKMFDEKPIRLLDEKPPRILDEKPPRILPVVYIQSPGSVKTAEPILHLSPINRTQAKPATKPLVLANPSKQQLVIPRSLVGNQLPGAIVPVTVATSGGTRQTYAYLSTYINKNGPTEGTATQQKVIIAPTKIANVILPMAVQHQPAAEIKPPPEEPEVKPPPPPSPPPENTDLICEEILPEEESLPVPIRKSIHGVSILKKSKSDPLKKRPPEEAPLPVIEPRKTAPPERRRKSQYSYLKDFDEIVVTSGNAWEPQETYKHFENSEITVTKLVTPAEESAPEVKSIEDVVEIELVKREKLEEAEEEIEEAGEEDKKPALLGSEEDISKILEWKDGIGTLPGSNLKFHLNEFNMLEMIVEDEMLKLKKPKSCSPKVENHLCCAECGCYGLPSEFISSSFCSMQCKVQREKLEAKRQIMREARAKRKRKRFDKGTDSAKEPAPLQAQPAGQAQSDEEVELMEISPQERGIYPWQTGKRGFSWPKYLDHVKAKAAPIKLWKDPYPYTKNGFRPGMKLEGVDPHHPSYFCVLTVAEVQGYRIRLHFDGFADNYDFWLNADSINIFPAGWCEKFNHFLHPPPHIHPAEFNWTNYLKQSRSTSAPRQLFVNRSGNSICPNGFRMGMKLEAVDRKNSNLVCVASVADQMDNRFLVHFDSWGDIYDYWADPSSPYIHPVGWCDENGHRLTPPNGYPNPETFTWERYLKETKAVAAPVRAFKTRPPSGFKKGMRVECVDKRVPQLVRVATIDDVKSNRVRISFDGWPDKYSYWIDDDSPDLHPFGWCSKTGHHLDPPLTPEDVYESVSDCTTVGCKGLGNIKGPRYATHTSAKFCPYADENLLQDRVLQDRLQTVADMEFKLEEVIPVSREPREIVRRRLGRPPKIRKPVESPEDSKEASRDSEEFEEVHRRRRTRHHHLHHHNHHHHHHQAYYGSQSQGVQQRATPPAGRRRFLVPEDVKGKLLEDSAPNPSKETWRRHSKYLSEFIPVSSNPLQWSESDVVEFVSSIPSCREHGELFGKHSIDGESLLMMSQHDLTTILGIKLGPALKLHSSILLLRQNALAAASTAEL